MYANEKQRAEVNRTSFYRAQYQTRCEMFTALESMHKCRANGDLKKLIRIAEYELGVHYQIKPEKLMPRKLEFILDICNLIGLAHIDKLKLPANCEQLGKLECLAAVLDVPLTDKNAIVPYVFGDQKTYRDPAEPDTSFLVFKRNIEWLEEHLKYATVPIEKCHLYHELGKQNLKQTKFDEARNYARKIVDEANEVDSYLWRFLGLILTCRAELMLRDPTQIRASLEAAAEAVELFENPDLSEVLDTCLWVRKLNETLIRRFSIEFCFVFPVVRWIVNHGQIYILLLIRTL